MRLYEGGTRIGKAAPGDGAIKGKRHQVDVIIGAKRKARTTYRILLSISGKQKARERAMDSEEAEDDGRANTI